MKTTVEKLVFGMIVICLAIMGFFGFLLIREIRKVGVAGIVEQIAHGSK